VFIAGFCILGLQFGLNAASAMIYPTSVRSNGSGWAFGVGRFGSILGPIFGGKLIALKLSVPMLFLIAAVPFVVGTAACIALATLYAARFKGVGLGERGTAAVSAAP
jgi:AAHS family 4-hydroxybenzoate transporter-like MFS transporter